METEDKTDIIIRKYLCLECGTEFDVEFVFGDIINKNVG